MNKRIAIYVRVSTQDQSTELQVSELQAYVKARGWSDVRIYEDKASGTTANRPSLKELLSDARQRKIDVVVCWKLDRFFRSLKHLVNTLQELTELGVGFISVRDNIDQTTAAGKLMTHVLGAIGEFEGSLIRERVRAGLQNARRKGKVLGRRPTLDRTQVASLRAQGRSQQEIATALGVTKSAVSKTLSKMTLQPAVITGPISALTGVAQTSV